MAQAGPWVTFLSCMPGLNCRSMVNRNRMLAAVAFFLALQLPAQAQGEFGIAPTDSLVSVFAVDSVTRIFQLDFPNQTGDSLALSWRWVDGGWTETWDVNLCDLGECYTGVPADADMMPMGPEGAGFLKLIVNSLETEGNCFLHFWVWPTGNQDALVNVFFDLRSDASVVSLVPTDPAQRRPLLYPVPAAPGTPLVLEWPRAERRPHAMQLFGPTGALLSCTPEWTGTHYQLNTENLPVGSYLLRYDPFEPALRFTLE